MRGPSVYHSGGVSRLPLRVLDLALGLVYPPFCPGCRTPAWGACGEGLCPDCLAALEWIGEGACDFCGAPAGPGADLGKGCRECDPARQRYTRASGLVRYAPPARGCVHALKFAGLRRLAGPLGRAMALRAREVGFADAAESVMPVPLHATRLAGRGYNQAALLARVVARELCLPLRLDALRRVRPTRAQATLPGRLRREAILGAFRADGELDGARVLLVDDVLTTGTTASECARVLREAGASRVYVLVFAR